MGVVAQSPAQGRASSGAVPGRFAAVPQGFGVKGTTPVPGSRGSGPAAGVTAGPEVWSVEELPVGSPATVTEALARQGEALAGRELADAALVEPPLAVEGLAELLQDGVSALNEARESAAGQARGFDFLEAANFAGTVEEISRTVEYLQIIAAHAVERTRNEARHAQRATTAGTSWRTGRTETHTAAPSTTEDTANGVLAAAGAIPGAAGPAGGVPASGAVPSGGVLAGGAGAGATAVPLTADTAAVLDDGYRNAAEFLRARLRISIKEARRRLALAPEILPRTTITGDPLPPRREHLAAATADAHIPSHAATIISTTLDKVRLLTDEDTLSRMEQALTKTALQSDPDFVSKMAQRWTDAINHDGTEPTEEILRQLQGAFIRKPRHGLHRIEIFATNEQFETLTTIMNTATNPRLQSTTHNDETGNAGRRCQTEETSSAKTARPSPTGSTGPDLDRRSRAQKLLDGLVGGCSLALATGKLPANGGLKPQVMVTIDHRDLYNQLQTTTPGTGATQLSGGSRLPGTATATFTGPIHPNTIRKIACDADILPVLLGSEGRILDVGRTTRIFPPHIRQALNARDQGCTFPDCTLPAPWCEAHHITYWSNGGTTSTDNGTLLCSHHHHLIHKEQWKITTKNGIPWYTPPPHIDPTQTPRRNHHHTPQRT